MNSLESREFFINLANESRKTKIQLNKTISIVTLHDNNSFIGEIISRNQNALTLQHLNNQETLILSTEIKNINTVKITDTLSSIQQNISSKITRETRIEFLRKIEYDTFKYFLNEVNKKTYGLISIYYIN